MLEISVFTFGLIKPICLDFFAEVVVLMQPLGAEQDRWFGTRLRPALIRVCYRPQAAIGLAG